MKIKRLITTGLAVAGFALAGPANADIMIVTGVICDSGPGSGCVTNVNFDNDDTGMTITGEVGNNTDIFVDVIGDETLLVNGGSVTAADGNGFQEADILLQQDLLGFGTIQILIDSTANGSVTLLMVDQFGGEFEETFDLVAGGQNWFSATSSNDQVIVSTSIKASVGIAIADIVNVRMDPTNRTCPVGTTGVYPDCVDGPITSVPEPGTLALLGIGLLGLGLRRRKV